SGGTPSRAGCRYAPRARRATIAARGTRTRSRAPAPSRRRPPYSGRPRPPSTGVSLGEMVYRRVNTESTHIATSALATKPAKTRNSRNWIVSHRFVSCDFVCFAVSWFSWSMLGSLRASRWTRIVLRRDRPRRNDLLRQRRATRQVFRERSPELHARLKGSRYHLCSARLALPSLSRDTRVTVSVALNARLKVSRYHLCS